MADPTNPTLPSTSPAGGSILVVAPPHRAEHVVRALEGLTAAHWPVGSVDEAMERLGADTLAIVLAPEGGPPPEPMLATLASEPRAAALPVLVVVDDGFPDERARTLHAAGAAAVLAWPSEVRLLPGLVLGLSDASIAVRRGQSIDEALGDAVEARIAVEATPAGELRSRVAGGTAILSGETDSPWHARRLRDLVGNVPGIERLDARGLHVIPPVVPDDELDRTVRDVVRSAMGEASDRIRITTNAGEVTLTGTVGSEGERHRIESVVENVPGVLHVDARLVVAEDEDEAAR